VSPKAWESTQGKLASYFERYQKILALENEGYIYNSQWQSYALEKEYHRLCEGAKKQIDQTINHFMSILMTATTEKQGGFLFDWIEVISQAGQDIEDMTLTSWGRSLSIGCIAFTTDEFFLAIDMFSRIIHDSLLEPRWKSAALTWRGHAHYLMKAYQDSVIDLTEAIKIQPSSEWSLRTRGSVYFLLENYEDSLRDLTQTIELNPKNVVNIAIRGLVYACIGEQEYALLDLSQAIEMSPDDESLLEQRGKLFWLSENLEKALADFKAASC
jgi:tetratricopeptide (TPR) repeat protein